MAYGKKTPMMGRRSMMNRPTRRPLNRSTQRPVAPRRSLRNPATNPFGGSSVRGPRINPRGISQVRSPFGGNSARRPNPGPRSHPPRWATYAKPKKIGGGY